MKISMNLICRKVVLTLVEIEITQRPGSFFLDLVKFRVPKMFTLHSRMRCNWIILDNCPRTHGSMTKAKAAWRRRPGIFCLVNHCRRLT